MNPDNLCMGCMAELAQPYARCPRCGLETRNYRRPQNSLPLYEIVNGKYMNGRVIGMLDMEGPRSRPLLMDTPWVTCRQQS